MSVSQLSPAVAVQAGDAEVDGPSAMSVYQLALREAAVHGVAAVAAVDERGQGQVRSFQLGRWSGGLIAGDRSVLARCRGATIDLGCGPGRLVQALRRRGQRALGVDISVEAVRLARRRGVPVLRRDAFGPLPHEGRWRRVLCTDGSIGIGGDPVRLLTRGRGLLTRDGQVLVEVEPPGSGTWWGELRLRYLAAGVTSRPFRWAYVASGELAEIAAEAGLRVLATWTEAGRWFASLTLA
jgi:SAM-dependent methyltransferase